MISEISKEIRNLIQSFPEEDQLIFNNKIVNLKKDNFRPIKPKIQNCRIAFVDGGQAEIISSGNFCLSFIRIFGQVFEGRVKKEYFKEEFYLLSSLKNLEGKTFSQAKIFSEKEIGICDGDLILPVEELSLIGEERTALIKLSNLARRMAELSLAKKIFFSKKADFILLDGTMDARFKCEEKIIASLPENVSALAKTSSLFTSSGNSPNILLKKIGPKGCWQYFISDRTSFVKLHEKASHIFRFEGNHEILPYLIDNSCDALFLGYPYGLIFVDRIARISNDEKKDLKVNFLLRKENQEILGYLNSLNAHEILDSLG